MCCVITTAILADFVADFLTSTNATFLSGLEKLNFFCKHAMHACISAVADACLNGGGGSRDLTEIQRFLSTCPGDLSMLASKYAL